MAKNRYVTHSAETLSAFEATDFDASTSVSLNHGEHLKVNLDVFASVTEIKLSFWTTLTPLSSSIVARVLDFDDPDDNGDRGLRCISSSLTSLGATENFEIDEDGYILAFRHDSSTGEYFSDADSWAEAKHTGDSSADYKYSRLDEVEAYGKSDDGYYEFKIVYPSISGGTNIWTQTSNPVHCNESRS